MANETELRPLPGPPAGAREKKDSQEVKLLNEEMTGAQQQLLLADYASASEDQKNSVIDEIAAGIPPLTEKTTKSSYHERDDFWTGDESDYKKKTYDENMVVWEEKMDKYLGGFKDKTGDKDFFRRIGIDLDQGADAQKVYKIFMDDHDGDVGYYADIIAQNFTPQEIEDNKDLIQTFGKIYGENSSQVATLLAEGIKNIRKNKAKFIQSAKKNIDQGDNMPGRDIVTTMQTNADMWDNNKPKRDAQRHAAEQRQQSPPETLSDEEINSITYDDEKLVNMMLYPDQNPPFLYDKLIDSVVESERQPWNQEEQVRAQEGMRKLFETELSPITFKEDGVEGARAGLRRLQSDPDKKDAFLTLYKAGRHLSYQEVEDYDILQSRGKFLHFGVNASYLNAPDRLPTSVRVYVTSKPSAIGEVTSRVITLAREKGYEPYGKVRDESTNAKGISPRTDRILFYPQTESQLKIIMDSLNEVYKTTPELFEEDPPILTEKTTIPGVGLAEDPPELYGEPQSFNNSRVDVLEEAWKATLDKIMGDNPTGHEGFMSGQGGHSLEKRFVDLREGIKNGTYQMTEVIKAYRKAIHDHATNHGIDPDHFARNLGSTIDIQKILSHEAPPPQTSPEPAVPLNESGSETSATEKLGDADKAWIDIAIGEAQKDPLTFDRRKRLESRLKGFQDRGGPTPGESAYYSKLTEQLKQGTIVVSSPTELAYALQKLKNSHEDITSIDEILDMQEKAKTQYENDPHRQFHIILTKKAGGELTLYSITNLDDELDSTDPVNLPEQQPEPAGESDTVEKSPEALADEYKSRIETVLNGNGFELREGDRDNLEQLKEEYLRLGGSVFWETQDEEEETQPVIDDSQEDESSNGRERKTKGNQGRGRSGNPHRTRGEGRQQQR